MPLRNEPRVVGVVSARMASTRCPGKALAPLAGRALLRVLLERVAAVPVLDSVALATSRLPDACEVHFVPRTDGLDDDFDGLPLRDRDLSALSGPARRDALQDAVLDGWPDLAGTVGADGELAPPPGHPPGLDPTAIFLARIFVAVEAGDPPARSGGVVADNGGRRFLPHLGMMAGALGLGLD